MFATTTLLLPMSRLGMCPQTLPLSRAVEMAVEILEAMDESVVARKSVEIIMQYLRDFRASNSGVQPATPSQGDGNGNGSVDPTLVGGAEPGSGLQTAFDIPVCFFFFLPREVRLWYCFANWYRNGRMGLDSRIIHLMGLHGFLMIWGVFLCWIIDFTCHLFGSYPIACI